MYIERGYTDNGTFGKWYTDDGEFICYSVEKRWRDNRPNISCVPEGTYGLREYQSPRFGLSLALVNHDLGVGIVPGESHRSMILIHAANKPSELQGCIAPASSLTSMSGEWAGSSSRDALKKVVKVAETESILELRAMHAIWVLP